MYYLKDDKFELVKQWTIYRSWYYLIRQDREQRRKVKAVDTRNEDGKSKL